MEAAGNIISRQMSPFAFPIGTPGHEKDAIQLTVDQKAPPEENMASNNLIELLNDLFETHSELSTAANVIKSSHRNTIVACNETISGSKNVVECYGNENIETLVPDILDYSGIAIERRSVSVRNEPAFSSSISIHNDVPVEDEWSKGKAPEISSITKSVSSNGETSLQRGSNNFKEIIQAGSGRDIVNDSLSNASNTSTNDTEHNDTEGDTQASNCDRKCTPVSSEVAPGSNSSKGHKRARRNDSVNCHDTLSICLPPCRVCNEKASGFHYGANTCEACKGFFRRTLAKKRVLFQCRCDEDKQEAWKVGPVRNGCSSCRYQRCLFVGMDKKAIKIGRYTLMRKSENIKEVKTLETLTNTYCNTLQYETKTTTSQESQPRRASFGCHHNTIVPLSSDHVTAPSPMKRPRLEITAFDWTNKADICKGSEVSEIDIDGLVKTLLETRQHCNKSCQNKAEHLASKIDECYEKYKLKTALFGEMKPPSMREHMEIYKATGIDIDDRFDDIRGAFAFFEKKVRYLIEFGKAIPGFKHLQLDDQASLIKATRVESSFIGGYRRFLSKCNMDLQVTVLPWGKAYHFNEMSKIYPKEYTMLKFILAREMQSLGLTLGEETLMRAIAITSGDRCQLNEPMKVRKINENMHRCLHHLLSKRTEGADHLMSKVFEIFPKFESLRDMDNTISKELFLGWPSLSNYHLLTEFFS